jgi:hypothetical protein
MQATIEQLSQIMIFSTLEPSDKISLQPHTQVQRYLQGEIVMHEGDRCYSTTAAGGIFGDFLPNSPEDLPTIIGGCFGSMFVVK